MKYLKNYRFLINPVCCFKIWDNKAYNKKVRGREAFGKAIA